MRGNHLVREARKRAGLTQAQLAERAGTTQSAIARLERGVTTPTLDHLTKLVRACGFDIEVQLVPYDDHDWSLVRQNAALDPQTRVDRALEWNRFARALQEAGRRARAGG